MKYPESKSEWYLNIYNKTSKKNEFENIIMGFNKAQAIEKVKSLYSSYMNDNYTVVLVKTEVVLVQG